MVKDFYLEQYDTKNENKLGEYNNIKEQLTISINIQQYMKVSENIWEYQSTVFHIADFTYFGINGTSAYSKINFGINGTFLSSYRGNSYVYTKIVKEYVAII